MVNPSVASGERGRGSKQSPRNCRGVRRTIALPVQTADTKMPAPTKKSQQKLLSTIATLASRRAAFNMPFAKGRRRAGLWSLQPPKNFGIFFFLPDQLVIINEEILPARAQIRSLSPSTPFSTLGHSCDYLGSMAMMRSFSGPRCAFIIIISGLLTLNGFPTMRQLPGPHPGNAGFIHQHQHIPSGRAVIGQRGRARIQRSYGKVSCRQGRTFFSVSKILAILIKCVFVATLPFGAFR